MALKVYKHINGSNLKIQMLRRLLVIWCDAFYIFEEDSKSFFDKKETKSDLVLIMH